jgi:hypothetical protein
MSMPDHGSNVLQVAVTGHTSFDHNKVDNIHELIMRALSEIKSSATDALRARLTHRKHAKHRVPRRPRLSVISCLAAGADQAVAGIGLQLGYALHAVLPGNAEDYQKVIKLKDEHAQHAARLEFKRLLAVASAKKQIGLPLPEYDNPEDSATRHVAYAAATRYMLHHCDILIAIADVVHKTDLGETGNAIHWAIQAGRPVVWIDPYSPDRLRWLSHLAPAEFTMHEQQKAEKCNVPDIAPDDESDCGSAARREGKDEETSDDFVVQTLRRKVTDILQAKLEGFGFLAERIPCRRSYWFSRMPAGVWSAVIDDRLPKELPFQEEVQPEHGYWAKLLHWLGQIGDGFRVGCLMLKGPPKRDPAKPQDPRFKPCLPAPMIHPQTAGHQATDSGIVSIVAKQIEAGRCRAKELAAFYSGLHRSSVLVLSILGVTAVMLASIPALFTQASPAAPVAAVTTLPGPTLPRNVTPVINEGAVERHGKVAASVELVTIVMMLIIYFCNRALRWQEKSINYRLLSERFRNSIPLVLVGMDSLDTAALPLQYSDHQLHKTWMEPYFQQLSNRIEETLSAHLGHHSPRQCFNDDHPHYLAACRTYLSGWLKGQADYQKATAAKYEALNLFLEAIQYTMLFATIGICALHLLMHWSPLNFFAAVCPAISGALASLAGQAEVVRLRDRSISMRRAICRRLRELKQSEPVQDAKSLRSFVETTAQNMLGEVIEWRVLFKFRPISSPA